MKRKSKFQKRVADATKWMAQFEDLVVKGDERHGGKIEWQSAYYFCNCGMTPSDAAALYLRNRSQ